MFGVDKPWTAPASYPIIKDDGGVSRCGKKCVCGAWWDASLRVSASVGARSVLF